LDPGSGMTKMVGSGSEIDIQDPQHWLCTLLEHLLYAVTKVKLTLMFTPFRRPFLWYRYFVAPPVFPWGDVFVVPEYLPHSFENIYL
jgi:hypothetical protein